VKSAALSYGKVPAWQRQSYRTEVAYLPNPATEVIEEQKALADKRYQLEKRFYVCRK
jgi:hypothetical protein